MLLVSCDGATKRVITPPARPFADISSARNAYSNALNRAINGRGFESRGGSGGGKWQTLEYHWRRQEDGNWLSVELRLNSETGEFDYFIKDWPRMTRSNDSKDIEQALLSASL